MSGKAIRGYLRQLSAHDDAVQLDALDGLMKFGPLAVEAVPNLIGLLDHPANAVRARTANLLGRMGPVAADAVEKLNSKLGDRSPTVRHHVQRALQRIGPVALPELIFSLIFAGEEAAVQATRSMAALERDAFPAVPYLTRALKAKSARLRKEAARALATLRPPLDKEQDILVHILRREEPLDRPALAEALAVFPKVAKAAVPMLRKLLQPPKEGSEDPRPAAIQALGRLGSAAVVAVPDLLAIVMGEDSPLRSPAIVALGRIGPEAADAVPSLLELLPQEGEKRTLKIVEAFGRMGAPAAEATMPVLVSMLPEAYGALRESLYKTFASFKSQASAAMVPLIQVIQGDGTAQVRIETMATLKAIGLHSPPLIHALTQALNDPHDEVRLAALDALSELERPDALSRTGLTRCLTDRDGQLRRRAARLLSRRGRMDQRSLDRCRRAVQSPYAEVRREAAAFLWYFSRRAREVVPVLHEALEDRSRVVRLEALALAEEIAQRDPRALPVLVQAMNNPDEPLGRPAGTALVRFGAVAVPALIEALEHPSTAIRTGALDVFARLDCNLTEALPALLRAGGDDEPNVRWAAARALGQWNTLDEQVVPVLLDLLVDDVPTVRNWASLAIAQHGAALLERLTSILQDPRVEARIGGCQAVALMGPAALASLWAVGPLLLDADVGVRRWAGRALDQIALDIQAKVEPLMSLLRCEHRPYQQWAARRLQREGERLLPLLLKQMTHQRGHVRWGAAECLGQMGALAAPTAPLLLRTLVNTDFSLEVRAKVSETLGHIGAAAVPTLTEALDYDDAEVRLGAVDALGRIGPASLPAVPRLLELLERDPTPTFHRFIAETFADIGPEAVEELTRRIGTQSDPECQARLIQALGVIGTPAQPGIDTLRPLLKAPTSAIRREVLWTLGRVGIPHSGHSELLQAVYEAIRDPAAEVREQVPGVLGRLGRAALPLLSRLIQDFTDARPPSRRSSPAEAASETTGLALRGIRALAESLREDREQLRDMAWVLQQPLANVLQSAPEEPLRVEAVHTLATLGRAGDGGSERRVFMQQLANNALPVQLAIVDALASFGSAAEPELRTALECEEGRTRRQAFAALITLQPEDLVERALAGLEDSDWGVSTAAANWLAKRPEHAERSVPALCATLRSPLSRVREASLKALKMLDPEGEQTVPTLVDCLAQKSLDLRIWAAREVGAYGERAAAATSLLLLMAPRMEYGLGSQAVQSLRQIGPAGVPAIKEMLQHPKAQVRAQAFEGVQHLDWKIGQQLQPYRKQMGSPPPDVIEKMDLLFEHFSGEQTPLNQHLEHLADARGWYQRYNAAMALGQLAEQEAIPADEIANVVKLLAKNLADNDYDVRRETARALGNLGKHAKGVAKELTERLNDKNPQVRVQVVIALSKMGEVPKTTIQTLVKMLNPKKNSHENLMHAAEILSKQGSRAAPAVKGLRTTLKVKDPRVRVWAAWALAQLKQKASEAIPDLKTLLKEPHPLVQAWVAAAYARLSDDAEGVKQALDRVVSCPDADVRHGIVSAVRALGSVGLEWLYAKLNDADPWIRAGSVAVLARLRRDPDNALPALERASGDPETIVREHAQDGLVFLRDPDNADQPADAPRAALQLPRF